MLKCADKWGSNSKDSPLTICRRARLGTGWRRSVDDILVAASDVGTIRGGVKGRHGEIWVLEELCSEVLEKEVRREGEENRTVYVVLSMCAVCVTSSVWSARMGMRMRIVGYYVQLGNVVYTASRSTEGLPPSLSFVMAGPCAAFGRTPSFSGSYSPHLLVGCEPSTSAPEHLKHLELPQYLHLQPAQHFPISQISKDISRQAVLLCSKLLTSNLPSFVSF